MTIVEPYAKIMNLDTREQGVDLLRMIEKCGRVSHRSEDAQTPDSWDRFLRAVVVGHGDWSITEHVSVSVEMVVDRAIQTEIVRHRLASYTIESTRFVNYDKNGNGLQFIKPLFKTEGCEYVWKCAMEGAACDYSTALRLGENPQTARDLLPLSLAGKIIMTSNLRNWRYFLQARTSQETHPKMRQVVEPLLLEFQAKIPILFEDIVPGERQVKAFGKAR